MENIRATVKANRCLRTSVEHPDGHKILIWEAGLEEETNRLCVTANYLDAAQAKELIEVLTAYRERMLGN